MYACETGHPGCVAALLENGASLICVVSLFQFFYHCKKLKFDGCPVCVGCQMAIDYSMWQF